MKTKRFINKKHIWPYLLVAPALIVVICVVFVPALDALLMSLRNYDLRLPAEEMGFIGLKNYTDILTDHEFWDALLRTVFMVVVCVSMQFIFGFILAMLLNHYFIGRGVIRAISMIPWVVPGVLAGLIWRWMYDGNYGVLNDILVKIGILDKFIPFLSQNQTSLPAVCITYIWQGIPFFLLMILAGLQSVPADTYEASRIDGANFLQSLFYVTIPSIKNTISITVMLRIIWIANSVDIIYNMTEGGPSNSTRTLAVFIYQKARAMDLGYSAAMAMLMILVLAVVAVPYTVITMRSDEEVG